MPKIIGQYIMSECYMCGETEPDESWDIHVRYLQKGEKQDGIVVRKSCCVYCMANHIIRWGESMQNGSIPFFENYDHEKQTAKIAKHLQR